MAKDYSQYKARINAMEEIDIWLNDRLESCTQDYEYYAHLHDEQHDSEWVLEELHKADYKVVILSEVIKDFEKKY